MDYTDIEFRSEIEWRKDYPQKVRDEMAKDGRAMPDGSYPIDDKEDLEDAIHAVGRGGSSHNAIRKHIIARAKALGCSDMIPDNWNSDGSLKREKVPAVPARAWSLREVEQPVVADFQVRSAEGSGEASLVGWPSTTGDGYEVSDWLGQYRETINPGAFSKTLKESDYVPLLLDHKGDVMAAYHRGDNRTMDLAEDKRGLRNEARLDIMDNGTSRTVASGVRRGDLSKMSFAFRATKEDWNEDYTERGVNELQLFDVSVVKSPANPNTTVGLRSEMHEWLGRGGRTVFFSARSLVLEGQWQQRDDGLFLLDVEDDEPFEQAITALRDIDSWQERQPSFRYAGRRRTFIVADLITQVRQGKSISSQNAQLLRNALDALAAADTALGKVDSALDQGQEAISTVLGVDNPNPDSETDENQSNLSKLDSQASNGGGVFPNDGAGVRSASVPASVRKAQREVELLKLRLTR